MKPQRPAESPTDDLFRKRLDNLIDRRHELVRLAALMDWDRFDAEWGEAFLHYLKHTYGLSDDEVVQRWAENPYWQYFCGETYFQHELSLNPSSLSRWRKRLGESGVESLLSATIEAALGSRAVKPRELRRVTMDTTVQEKAVAFPTDSKLYNRARERLVRLAKAQAIPRRQSYVRVGPRRLC